MASSCVLCLIIAFIIFVEEVKARPIFCEFLEMPDEELEGNRESACVKMLTKFKSKVNELTQEMEILTKIEEEDPGSGIYSTQEMTEMKSRLTELTETLETLINNKMDGSGSASGSIPSQEMTEMKSRLTELTETLETLINNKMDGSGSASGSIPSQEENGEGSASAYCNPQEMTEMKSRLTELTETLETLINNKMDGSGSASGSIQSQEENGEGSASAYCNPQMLTKFKSKVNKLTQEMEILTKIDEEDTGSGIYSTQASRATVDPTEDPFTDQVCPHGWAHHGHSCFQIIDTPTPKWRKARAMCQTLGGDLGKITTASENQFIYDLLRKQKTVTHYGVWLGLYRKKDQQFYWVDDTPLSGYTEWGQGEPNDSQGRENCVHKIGEKRSWPFQPGQWNDVPCSLHGIVSSQIAPVVLCQKKIAMDVLSF